VYFGQPAGIYMVASLNISNAPPTIAQNVQARVEITQFALGVELLPRLR
jgi:hypothetical protein